MSLTWVLLGLRILATVVLYVFLGVTFYLIWRDLKQAAIRPAEVPVLGQLRPVETEHQDLVSKEVLPLQGVTSIGRALENNVMLDDEATSLYHASLYHADGVWWVEDLGSTNGTTINELPISKPTPLAHGDLIEIGHNRFRLEIIEV